MEKKRTAPARARTTTKTAAAKTTAAKPATPRKRATRASAPVTGSAFHPTHDQIANFAYSLFEQSGHQHGRALEHWLEAESRLRQGLEVR